MAVSSPKDWSLFDHLAFLLGRWYLPTVAAIVCAAAGYAAGTWLTTKTAAEGLLRVGTAYSVGLLAKPADVAARISSQAFLGSVVTSHPKMFPKGTRGLSLTAMVPESTDLVRITATAPGALKAGSLVRLAARRVASDHDRIYDRVEKLAEKQLASMTAEADGYQHALAALSATPPQAGATAKAFLAARRESMVNELQRLRNRIDQYQLRSDPGVNPRTALVDGPSTHEVSDRKKAAVLAGVCGLVLGGFLAYFLAFLRRRSTAAAGSPVTPLTEGRAAGGG